MEKAGGVVIIDNANVLLEKEDGMKSEHLRLAFLLILWAIPSSLPASEKFQVTLSGTVQTVDPALQSAFHVGDAFEFGFLLDTANLLGYGGGSTTYNLKNVYFKVGSNYSASAPTGSGPVSVRFTSVALEQGG